MSTTRAIRYIVKDGDKYLGTRRQVMPSRTNEVFWEDSLDKARIMMNVGAARNVLTRAKASPEARVYEVEIVETGVRL